jgi:hypothetical protein
MHLLANDWAIPGDTTPHTLVAASTDQALLGAYAGLRPDGKLSLLVVNKDPATAYTATLKLRGFAPKAQAAVWTFDATNYAWKAEAAPSHAAPDTAPSSRPFSGVAPAFEYTFPACSITVMQLSGSVQGP